MVRAKISAAELVDITHQIIDPDVTWLINREKEIKPLDNANNANA